jgi:ribonuclease BN (tRNA processing enzyme)
MQITTIGYWGAYPAANEATSGYLLQADGTNILIDCGSGVLSLLQNRLKLEELDAVLLSHYHTDHMADIFSLQYAVMILMQLGRRKKPLDIYAPAEDGENFAKMAYGSYCNAHPIAAGTELQLGSCRFTFAKNIHPVSCLSMRVENKNRSIVYSSDTEWNDDLIRIADGADLFICESSLYHEQLGTISGHLTAGQAGEIAHRARVKRLVLTHLPHYGDHSRLIAQAEAEYQGVIELACSWKSWDL